MSPLTRVAAQDAPIQRAEPIFKPLAAKVAAVRDDHGLLGDRRGGACRSMNWESPDLLKYGGFLLMAILSSRDARSACRGSPERSP